jgi:hypothetical protein
MQGLLIIGGYRTVVGNRSGTSEVIQMGDSPSVGASKPEQMRSGLQVTAFDQGHHRVARAIRISTGKRRVLHGADEFGEGGVTEDVANPAGEVPVVHVVGDDRGLVRPRTAQNSSTFAAAAPTGPLSSRKMKRRSPGMDPWAYLC